MPKRTPIEVGLTATSFITIKPEVVAERECNPVVRMDFEVVASGANQYGNCTSTVVTRDDIGKSWCNPKHYDTRYFKGSFEELCEQIVEDTFGENAQSTKTLRYYNKIDGERIAITYDKALDIMLGTWKDNDMTRDMLQMPNNIQCMFSDIFVEEMTKDGTMVLMAGMWNMLPMDTEYDKEGNHATAKIKS